MHIPLTSRYGCSFKRPRISLIDITAHKVGHGKDLVAKPLVVIEMVLNGEVLQKQYPIIDSMLTSELLTSPLSSA